MIQQMDYQELSTFKACDKIRKHVIEGIVKLDFEADASKFVIMKMINLTSITIFTKTKRFVARGRDLEEIRNNLSELAL